MPKRVPPVYVIGSSSSLFCINHPDRRRRRRRRRLIFTSVPLTLQQSSGRVVLGRLVRSAGGGRTPAARASPRRKNTK